MFGPEVRRWRSMWSPVGGKSISVALWIFCLSSMIVSEGWTRMKNVFVPRLTRTCIDAGDCGETEDDGESSARERTDGVVSDRRGDD